MSDRCKRQRDFIAEAKARLYERLGNARAQMDAEDFATLFEIELSKEIAAAFLLEEGRSLEAFVAEARENSELVEKQKQEIEELKREIEEHRTFGGPGQGNVEG